MAAIIASHHATTEEVGRVAAAAGVGTVVLSHVVPPAAPGEVIRGEIARHFGGEILIGEDLLRV